MFKFFSQKTRRTGNASRNTTSHHDRSGIAATEFALLLPLVLILFAGTIELCTAIFLKESLTIAAYEGARKAAKRAALDADAMSRVVYILNERGVNMTEIQDLTAPYCTISPSAQTANTLQPISVTVRAPTKKNIFAPFSFLSFCQYKELTATVVMYKEYKN